MTGRVAVVVLASSAAMVSEAAVQRRVTAVQSLGIPLEVSIHVDVAADWRHVDARMSTYVVGGFLRLTFRETSELTQPGEAVTESRTGALLLAGIDFALSRWVRLGGELRYRRMGVVLGSAGRRAGRGTTSTEIKRHLHGTFTPGRAGPP